MAGGMAPLGVKKERAAEYKGQMTLAVAMACVVAAIGGSIFGYDIGISVSQVGVGLLDYSG
uniref:Major facilitator superfamily (MFS) profile domain-containing protein n=1 Tax=Aegilops tauschii TaxID=37682 RepID=M8C9R8_AEGTA